MNILIVTPHFWPENFPINTIAKYLSKKNKVSILTGTPHYPNYKKFKKYQNLFSCKKYASIQIIRIPIFIRKKSNILHISLNYISFVVSFFLYKKRVIKNLKTVDTILNYGVSPITSAIPCLYLKKKMKCRLNIWVQDIWPESVKSTGFINNSLIYFVIKKISNIIYASADKLIVQSEGFKRILKKRRFKNIKLFYNSYEIPNYKNINKYYKVKNLLENNFCITYTGNIGAAQKFNTLFKIAIRLKNKSKIKFLLIGEGSKKLKLKAKIKKYNLKNVFIFDQIDKSYVNTIQKKSKILYLSLKKNFIFNNTIPSKLQQYISIGTPIAGELQGVSKNILMKSKCGYIIKYNSVKSFENIINKVYSLNKKKINVIRKNGKNFFNQNFNIKNNIKKLENEI